jgi:signal transduction histidine kinase
MSKTMPTTVGRTTERDGAADGRRRRGRGLGLRARILLQFVGLFAVGVVASVLVARQVLVVRLEERIEAEHRQEVSELRRLAGGLDPETSRPFGTDVERVFEVFLQRNIPSRHEVFLTFVDGEPFLRSAQRAPYRLDRDGELVTRWGALSTSDRGEVDTPAGPVRFLGVPVGGRGVFVVASFWDREADDLDEPIVALALVALAVLVLGSVLAWRLAQRVLKPVADVTGTARSISAASFEGRIPVRGSDEIARLAQTFNEMLDRLEGSFETQRRFLDDAGHELRTPLTIVRGHLELLGDDPEERRQTLALVLDELERMGRMVDDLMVLARADEPDFLHLDPVDVGALTDELSTKASALGRRDWQIDSTGRGIIVADRQRLTQAVVQLAQNAVQHTDEGDSIALGSLVRPGEARFWVRDTGPGVAPADARRIFGRFERGASSRRREGAGLGLAIVEAIAAAHGGRVELDGTPGRGATFTLVVPTDQLEREGLPA